MKNILKNKFWYFLPMFLVLVYARPVLGAGDFYCSFDPSEYYDLTTHFEVLIICSISGLIILFVYAFLFLPLLIALVLIWKSRDKNLDCKNKLRFWSFVLILLILLQVVVWILFYMLNKGYF